MSSINFEQALHGSPNDKGEYLKNLRFMHKNLEDVIDEVKRRMLPGAGLSLTIVAGPSGVGKSTFAALQAEALLKLYDVEIRENPGVIPVVLNEVDAADGKEFNWRLFYQHLSEDLHLLSPDYPGLRGIDGEPFGVRNYRLTFEKGMRFRKVRHLILDEAVHFTDSKTEPLQYGNLLKSLANRSGMNLLLVGAYGSEKLVLASGQIARRISVVHFKRYHDNQDDFDAFTQFIKEFEEHIPLPFKVDLKKYTEQLFYAHLGMPGYAAGALIEAVSQCAYEGSQSWEDRYVWNALPSQAEYETIAAETLAGEDNIKPYLSLTQPMTYPSEAELLVRVNARQARNRGNSQRGLWQ
ncbi:AAA family ATPase [Paraburkholderia sediminicola]|uniref:AAA family ATPase n=1 Tax=Paraburkholderia sediminicola TaxID=458836 RepID=UPI0038B89148